MKLIQLVGIFTINRPSQQANSGIYEKKKIKTRVVDGVLIPLVCLKHENCRYQFSTNLNYIPI